ncbi:MAG: thioesterase family protein [Candidatus Cyclobacteriaceae bacterium M2_1C_046]
MARIKIDLPEKFIYKHNLKVRISDLNYGAHTGNDTILTFMHEARMNFLRSLGIKDEVNITPDAGIIVADAAVVYKSETFFGDKIHILVAIEDISRYGMDMYYLLKKENGKEVARGKTGIVFFSYKNRKITEIPTQFLEQVKKLDLINN